MCVACLGLCRDRWVGTCNRCRRLVLVVFLFLFLHNRPKTCRLGCRWRPYRVECTGSLPTSEVKRRRARLVLGWGTAREDLRVPPAFATPTLLRPQPATTLARLQPAARTDAQQAPPESPEQQAQDQARPQPNATWSGRRGRTRAHIAQHTRARNVHAHAHAHKHTHTHSHTH